MALGWMVVQWKTPETIRLIPMNTSEIKKMSTIERLQTMEAIWDTLLYDEIEIESPEWHRDVLEERRRKIDSGKAKFFSVEELKKRHK